MNNKLGMNDLIPNTQIQQIIKWFEKQRAYRAEIWRIDEDVEVKTPNDQTKTSTHSLSKSVNDDSPKHKSKLIKNDLL